MTPTGGPTNNPWQTPTSKTGSYADIPGATSTPYTLVTADVGYSLQLVAIGAGGYTGTVFRSRTGKTRMLNADIF